MPPPYLSAFYLAVPLFSVPVIIRNGTRSIYTPVPLLALLALLAGGFGQVENPRVQAVLQVILAVTLGGSVLHLQGLVDAPVPMLATTALFLICATLLSFSPRLSQVSPMLFLIFIVATLITTVLVFLARRRTRSSVTLILTPAPPSPTPSHTSFQYTNSLIEKPPLASLRSPSEFNLSPQRPSLQRHVPPAPSNKTDLFLLLSFQLSYMIATAFCIPTALRLPATGSPPLVFLVSGSSDHVYLSTYIFCFFDTVFRIVALLLVFGAYYHCSSYLPLRGIGEEPSSFTINRTPTIPRRPNARILSPSTSPTPTLLHTLVLPSSPTSTSPSPIKLDFFKPKHKRAGPSASSSFFSPRPKRNPLQRSPLASTSEIDLQPEIDKRALDELDLEPISPCPSSSTTCVASSPTTPAPNMKERSSFDGAFPLPNPASNSVLVRVATPLPVLCRERAWSWAHSMHIPKDRREVKDVRFEDEDCTDLRDPFASDPVRPPVAPSAYKRWAASVEELSESHGARRWSEHGTCPQTQMNASDRLPYHHARQGRTAPSLRIDTTVCTSD